MKKLAVFVEGQTEQIFVAKLLEEIAGSKNVEIVNQKGIFKNGKRYFLVIDAKGREVAPEKKYYVLIRDCGGESQVKSDIVDASESLFRERYEMILGLRDVSPNFTYNDIPKLKSYLNYKVPTKYVPIHMLLSIMEIEAWFLAECSHYCKINSCITKESVINKIGFDPDVIDVESRPFPSNDLDAIYKVGGCAYKKDRKRVQRTIDVLNYSVIYLDLSNRIGGLSDFVKKIDLFFN